VDRAVLLKVEKWAIWIALIVILILVRHLFPIFFLTFVISYIANTGVNYLRRWIGPRRVSVVVVYALLLAIIAGIALLVVPRMIGEATTLARIYMRTEGAREGVDQEGMIRREAREVIDSALLTIAGRETFESFRASEAYRVLITRVNNGIANATPRIVRAVTVFANDAIATVFAFGISIILSFLMLWNLPETKERMKKFAHGRTADVYAEIAPGARAFGVMLGRAFEAQTVVAIVNTILSTILFMLLGLHSVALLAMIVFVCSYIPILGMLLSTAPAALLAFRIGGFTHVLWLIGGVLVIHAIEAYMLNPLIYGRHLRLHPLAVLVILLVAEHLFGVWGLLLGVPISAFLLRYALEGEDVEHPRPKPDPASV
jgi:predicted PurR-regulated permease PerM